MTTAAGAALEVLFTPDATAAEVTELYPGASIEPLPDAAGRAATTAEATELRRLIGAVLADVPDEHAEALRVALADPDAALECLRALAARDCIGLGTAQAIISEYDMIDRVGLRA